MPNPSTIASYEDGALVERTTEMIAGQQVAHIKTTTIPALLVQIEELKQQLADERQNNFELKETVGRRSLALNDQYFKLGDQIATLKLRNQELLGATAQMGEQLRTMEESRDRVLAENCGMTQKLHDLQKIARAAKEYCLAEAAFVEEISPSDEVTERVANAECELERLLEEHKNHYHLETT